MASEEDLIGALNDGPVLLLREGEPCAALVALDERFDREAFSLGRDKRVRRIIDDACLKTRETGGISFADIVREIAPQPARKRRKRRQPGKA